MQTARVSTASVRVGLLADLPGSPHDALFAAALRLGLDEARSGAPIELVTVQAPGLPFGTLGAVVAGVHELAAAGVVLMVGPAITDNALAARSVVDGLELPAINYAGGAETCSPWMFQYPIGSLEDEPAVLVARLVRRGLRRVAVVSDRSALGARYRECFEAARGATLEVCAPPHRSHRRTSMSAPRSRRCARRRPTRSSISGSGFRRTPWPPGSGRSAGRCRCWRTRR
jgi:outer membrane PBP1 activator LpoA protein